MLGSISSRFSSSSQRTAGLGVSITGPCRLFVWCKERGLTKRVEIEPTKVESIEEWRTNKQLFLRRK